MALNLGCRTQAAALTGPGTALSRPIRADRFFVVSNGRPLGWCACRVAATLHQVAGWNRTGLGRPPASARLRCGLDGVSEHRLSGRRLASGYPGDLEPWPPLRMGQSKTSPADGMVRPRMDVGIPADGLVSATARDDQLRNS